MIEPEWVEEDSALAIHDHQLAQHGGGQGVRDLGLLKSALARPLNAFHYQRVVSLSQLAASYGFGICKNHPFVDGNKRTAFVVTRLFLKLNGFDLNASKEEKYLTFLTLAEGRLSEEELAAWLESKLMELPKKK
jgi:death-on-curing protein